MKIPHPVQYQGSKRNLAATILQYFPDNVQTLIEPFAGTAAISVAIAYHGMANRFLINDLNKPLNDLLQGIIEQSGRVGCCPPLTDVSTLQQVGDAPPYTIQRIL